MSRNGIRDMAVEEASDVPRATTTCLRRREASLRGGGPRHALEAGSVCRALLQLGVRSGGARRSPIHSRVKAPLGIGRGPPRPHRGAGPQPQGAACVCLPTMAGNL